MASEPSYPIDDEPNSDDAKAPEAEPISQPADQPIASAPELSPDPAPDPIAAVSATSDSGPATPPPAVSTDTAPAPAASFGPKSVRGGNMFMRVLSRALQDLEVVTGGKRAATYGKVDHYVGRSQRTELALERAAIAAQSAQARPPVASTPSQGATSSNGPQNASITAAPSSGQAQPAGVESHDPGATPDARQQPPRPTIPETDDAPTGNQPDAAPQDAGTGRQASGDYDPNFITVVQGGTGSLTQSFLGRASDPGAAQWLEGFVGQYGVAGVVDEFLQSGTVKDFTAVRDAAARYVAQDKSRTNTRLLAEALSDILNPKDDIVVSAPRRSPAPRSRNADNHNVSVQVPVQGNGFRVYGDRHHQYGTQRTIDAITDISQAWAQLHPQSSVQIGEVSRNGGGPLPPHHSDRTGTDFDVRPFRIDRRPAPVDRRSPDYDGNTTVDFLRFVHHRYPDALILFNDPVAIRQGFSRHWAGHDNHMHIRVR